MNRVENKNQIVDINGYVHVINGRVLCFKSDLYDLSENSDDVKYLTEFVNGLPTKRCFDASFGDFTIYLFTKVSDGIAVTQGDLYVYLQELTQDVSEKVRQAINEYRGKSGMTADALPETAVFEEEVERIMEPDAEDILWFGLKKGDISFKIGLSDILMCLKFAEGQGEVPKLPPSWWSQLSSLYPKLDIFLNN